MTKVQFLAALVIIIAVFGLRSPACMAQNAPKTSIGVIEAPAQGSFIEVPIHVTGLYNVKAISLTIRYNPQSLTFIGGSNTSDLQDLMINSSIPGEIKIAAMGAVYSLADGTLATLAFKYLQGQSDISFFDNGESCEYAGMTLKALNDKPSNQYFKSGIVIPVVTINDQVWMRENLNTGNKIPISSNAASNGVVEKYCWGGLDANCTRFGGLYQWDEMMNYQSAEGSQGICPDGWRIPTTLDFEKLAKFTRYDSSETCSTYVGKVFYNQSAIDLKSKTGWTTAGKDTKGHQLQCNNGTGFSAKPNGNTWANQYKNGPDFFSAQFWTSSLVAGVNLRADYGSDKTLYPVYWTMIRADNGFAPMGGYKAMGFPVRCIKQ